MQGVWDSEGSADEEGAGDNREVVEKNKGSGRFFFVSNHSNKVSYWNIGHSYQSHIHHAAAKN